MNVVMKRKTPTCNYGSAVVCCVWGKPDQAVGAFTESIRLDPREAEAYQLRGQAYQRIGETKKAEADLAKAKQLPAREEAEENGTGLILAK